MDHRDIHTPTSNLHWPKLSGATPPEPGTVHIFCSILRCEPEVLPTWERLLSEEEVQRASRFRTGELRHRFIVSRGVLRRVLGECTNVDAKRVQFASDANGKPRLADECGIHFNLAHTGDLMLLALARDMPVGVDVERIRGLKDSQAIARRFFTKREGDWLQGMDGEVLDQAFFSLWTRKEAILKATGEGISSGLDSIELLDAGGRFNDTIVREPGNSTANAWRLTELQPARGFIGAFALPASAGSPKLRTATFRPS